MKINRAANIPSEIEINDAFLDYLKSFVTPQRVERFENVINKRLKNIYLALEDIFQGHNASAVLRTSEALGIQNVFVIENQNQFVPNDEIALGAEKWIDIHRFKGEKGTITAIRHLQSMGVKVYASSPHYSGFTPSTIPIEEPLAVLFGTEKDGLTAEALEACDGYLQIPMYGLTESFNISVSAAISMSEIVNRIRSAEINSYYSPEEQKMMLASWILKTVSAPEGILKRWLNQG